MEFNFSETLFQSAEDTYLLCHITATFEKIMPPYCIGYGYHGGRKGLYLDLALCFQTSVYFSHLDLNLIDWSSLNFLAVALDKSVYLWNYDSREIIQLMQMENPDDYISSVSWIKEGNYLAIGTSNAEVQVRQLRLCLMTSVHIANLYSGNGAENKKPFIKAS